MKISSKSIYNDSLKEIIEDKKKEWFENVKDLMPYIRSKDPHDMTDAQAMALSYRTMLLEEISYFVGELSNEQKVLKELKRDRFILYTSGMVLDKEGNYVRVTGNIASHPMIGHSKVSGSQKEMIISGDLSEYELTQEILIQMIEYLRENIKTIDSYMYSIKNRLDLFNMFK